MTSEWMEPSGRPRQSWRVPLIAGLISVAGAGLLLLVLSVGYQLAHSGLVYRGVSVGNVAVGGMTKEGALARLRPIYENRSAGPVVLRMDDLETKATLTEMGISFDPSAAVEAAFQVGREGGLVEQLGEQLGALTGGHAVDAPGVKVDRVKLDAFLAQQARAVDRSVKEAELVIGDDFGVKVTPEVIGRRLDGAAAATAIERGLPTASDAIELPVLKTLPKRVQSDLEEARAKLEKIYAGPVSLEFEGQQWTLSLKEIASIASVDQKAGVTSPTVLLQEESLKGLVERIGTEVDQTKADGRYDWNGGNLKALQPGKDGRKLDRAKTLEVLREAITSDRKNVALPVEVDKAIGGSINASVLDIKERIDFGQTAISGVPEKVHNIKLAASRLHGVVVPPGEIFSFNKELGPTTLKAGFQTGFAISVNDGEMQTVPSVAGGICQVATTLLHAVFWAGYQVEERYPHMYWIASYGQPPRGLTGLDTTVDPPSLDFKFMNNTEDYLLIQSSTAGNQLVFELYGTKPSWKVQVEGPIITNTVKADPQVVRQREPSWEAGRELWVERATDGFDVKVVRKVVQGDDVRTLELKSHYVPSRNVILVGGTGPIDEPTPSTTPGATPGATPPGATPVRTPAAAPSRTPAPGAAATPAAPARTATPGAGAPQPPAATPTPKR